MSDVAVHSIATSTPSSSTVQPKRHGASWQPVTLADYMASSYKKATPTIGSVANSDVALFIPGKINTLFGQSGGGKTFFMLHVMKEEIDKGNDVAYVDYEDSPETAIQRLRQLGSTDQEILDHLLYIQPSEKWSPRAEQQLQQSLNSRKVSLVVIDSVGESIANDGYNPNDDKEVVHWFDGAVSYFSKTVGAAVVLLDHVTKANTKNRDVDHAAGSQRKRARIDGTAYSLHVITPSSRHKDGEFEFVCRKDRNGWRDENSVAAIVKMLNGQNGTVTFTVTQPTDTTRKPFSPTRCMEKISQLLQSQTEPMSKSEIARNIKNGNDIVSAAIDRLVAEGFCQQTEGPRRAKMIGFVKAYAEDVVNTGRQENPF